MGSWYETCGLSHLPIIDNDPAMLVLLQPGTSCGDCSSGFCYPSGMFQPLFPAISGSYNSYGTIKDPEVADMAVFDNVLSECRVAKAPNILERIERAETTGRVFGKDFHVGQMLVRRDVWDEIVSKGYDTIPREEMHRAAREWVRYVEGLRALPPIEMSREMFKLDLECKKSSAPFLRCLCENEDNSGMTLCKIALTEMLLNNTIDLARADKVACAMADMFTVHYQLRWLRMAWGPTQGKGSQDTAWEAVIEFSGMVARLARTAQVQHEDDDSPPLPTPERMIRCALGFALSHGVYIDRALSGRFYVKRGTGDDSSPDFWHHGKRKWVFGWEAPDPIEDIMTVWAQAEVASQHARERG